MSSSYSHKGSFKIVLIIFLVPVLALAGFLFFATAQLRRSDEEVLKTYQPASKVTELAEKNGLTDKGKAILYRADPIFVDASTFKRYCAAGGVEALACIGPKAGGGPFGGRQIFLLEIDDPKFADHKYAASIHEMLHHAYDRLSQSEKEQLNTLLDQELSKYQNDPHLTTVIETLDKKSKKGKDDIHSELHSKFGVEYKDISPQLEEYYKQYFVNRNKVVDLFQKGGFNSRVRRIDQLKYELNPLNTKLTNMNNQLTSLKNSGDVDKFNSLVGQFNGLVNQYNAKVAEINKVHKEVEGFYTYFNPDYKPPEEKK